MATIASLNIGLGADSAQLKRDLNKAESATKKFAKKAERNVNKLSKSFKGLGVAMAGIAAAAGVGKLLETSDAMVKSADAAGIAFDSYQRLQFGLEQSGVSAAGFQKSTLKLNKVLLDASRGSKTASDALGRIGLSFEQLDAMKPEERYTAVLRALEGVDDKGAKAAISMELLGKEFAGRNINVDAMLEAGKGIATIDEDAARSAEGINDAMNRIGTSFQNLMANVLLPIIGAVTPVIDAISQFAADNPKMASTIAGIGVLAVSVGALGAAFSLLSWPIVAIGAAIGGLVAIWANWDSIVKASDQFLSEKFGFTLSGIIESVKEMASWLGEKLSPAFEVLKDHAKTTIDNMVLLFGAIQDIFTLDFGSAGEKMMKAFQNVTDFFVRNFGDAINNLVQNTKEQFKWAFEAVAIAFKNFFKGAMNAVLKPIETFVNDLVDKVNSIARTDFSHVSMGGFEKEAMPQNPGWQDFNQRGLPAPGQTTGTGLTQGVLPPPGMSTGTGLTSAELPPATNTATNPTTPGGGFGDSGTGGFGGAGGGMGANGGDKTQEVTDSFLESIKSSLSTALKTGDWKSFATSILDQTTSNFIEQFSSGLVDGLAEGLGLGGGDGKGFFDGMFEGFGNNVQNGVSGALEGSNFQGIFQNFGSMLKDSFGGIMEGLQGMFSGMGGGGGGFGGLMGMMGGGGGGFGGLLGMFAFNEGGVVPNSPTPFKSLHQGRDKVVGLLEPNEVVIPADQVDSVLNNNNGGAGTTVNFNITGDISRQTERKILEMTPTITQMVNAQNKENGA